jgi:hypothetical protein
MSWGYVSGTAPEASSTPSDYPLVHSPKKILGLDLGGFDSFGPVPEFKSHLLQHNRDGIFRFVARWRRAFECV